MRRVLARGGTLEEGLYGIEDKLQTSVDSWKSETTHDDFIPEHRISYFKRKSDGAIVWDREKRRDEIFGSGVTSLAASGTQGTLHEKEP